MFASVKDSVTTVFWVSTEFSSTVFGIAVKYSSVCKSHFVNKLERSPLCPPVQNDLLEKKLLAPILFPFFLADCDARTGCQNSVTGPPWKGLPTRRWTRFLVCYCEAPSNELIEAYTPVADLNFSSLSSPPPAASDLRFIFILVS